MVIFKKGNPLTKIKKRIFAIKILQGLENKISVIVRRRTLETKKETSNAGKETRL